MVKQVLTKDNTDALLIRFPYVYYCSINGFNGETLFVKTNGITSYLMIVNTTLDDAYI